MIGVVDANCVISGDLTGNITNQPAGLDPNGPQANGSSGPLTVALISGSLAIDAADPTTAAATDERGFVRPQGPAPDIGAFEFGAVPPSPTPTPTPTPGGGGSINGGDISGSGCSLIALSNIGGSGWLSLLPLAAVGLAALRRRAK